MAAQLNICLQRNEDWSRTLYLKADLGGSGNYEPIDLTGMTIAMQVRDKITQALIAQADLEVNDAANGEVTVTLLASEGSPLSAYGSAIQNINLPYDLRITDGDGLHTVLFGGQIILSRGETTT
jgi:hypothetical protein